MNFRYTRISDMKTNNDFVGDDLKMFNEYELENPRLKVE